MEGEDSAKTTQPDETMSPYFPFPLLCGAVPIVFGTRDWFHEGQLFS